MKKLVIGVSACLLGFKYRYDGQSDLFSELIEQLKDIAVFIPVCPEVESGLPVPRPKMHIEPSARGTRLIVTETGEDKTDSVLQWAAEKMEILSGKRLDGFIFHSKSPCCGMGTTKLRSGGRIVSEKGTGIFAAVFRRRFPELAVGDETDLPAFLKKINVEP